MPQDNDLKIMSNDSTAKAQEWEIHPAGFLDQTEIQPEPILPVHFHETDKIDFRDIRHRKLYIHHTIYGADAATAGNYGVFWIAPFECTITEIREVHQTAGTDAGAVSLQIEKLTGTQALDAGVALLVTAFDLKGTANTVNTGTLTATEANRLLARGNRLAMDDAGTLTSCANVSVVIEITF